MFGKVSETDNGLIGPPPTLDQITSYLIDMKNETAPCSDQVNVDLLKGALNLVFDELVEISGEIWLNNEIPEIWLETS